ELQGLDGRRMSVSVAIARTRTTDETKDAGKRDIVTIWAERVVAADRAAVPAFPGAKVAEAARRLNWGVRPRRAHRMADAVEEMRARLRSSLDPVSAFYLVDSPAAIDRMLAKAAALGPFGVSAEQLAVIRTAAGEWLRSRASTASAPRQLWLEF